tara:strand:+ start:636 stop:1028 length:393 start_codon:yes stop_codon:yes gene_type:complete
MAMGKAKMAKKKKLKGGGMAKMAKKRMMGGGMAKMAKKKKMRGGGMSAKKKMMGGGMAKMAKKKMMRGGGAAMGKKKILNANQGADVKAALDTSSKSAFIASALKRNPSLSRPEIIAIFNAVKGMKPKDK